MAEHQPAKLAAMEGHYPASEAADAYIIGWVNEETEEVSGIAVPGLLSFLVHWDFEEPVTGLRAFPPDKRPPVNIVFQSYHAMVMIGVFLIVLSWIGLLFWWRKQLFNYRWLLYIMVFSVLGPQLANQLGWITAEVGRQPYIVYGLLETKNSLSPSVEAGEVIASLVMFGLIYLLLFVLFIYLLNGKIQHGPEEAELETGHLA
uniref:Cytochrome D ubiquinol oxidase subunit I n=1 Tax=uncultured bacterium pAW1 TaxID=1781155 RepID=A0A1C9U4N7_9BACT|nr:cytochrome D ubiquinol oxidase subunit I [uncultured bacterium pAW1]